MTYHVPESKRSIAQNQFIFDVPGDETIYSIPKAKYLPIGTIEHLSTNSGQISITDILDLIGDTAARDAARTLDQEQLQALMSAWQEDSGLTMGESSASAPTS